MRHRRICFLESVDSGSEQAGDAIIRHVHHLEASHWPNPLVQDGDSLARGLLNNSGASVWDPNPWPDDPTTVNLDHGISAALVDSEELAQSHPHAGSNDGVFDADTMQYDFGDLQSRPAQSLPTSTPTLSQSPGKFVMADDNTTWNQTMENALRASLQYFALGSSQS